MTFGIPLLLALSSPATAQQSPEISGYVQPSLALRYLPQAVPQYRLAYGLEESRAGLQFKGKGTERWDYNIYLYLTGETIEVLTHAIALDTDNDGDAEKVYTRSESAARNLLREAWAAWTPSEGMQVHFGRMSVPFTTQAQANDTELLFPDRASPNAVFLEGRDLGAVAKLDVNDGVFQAQIGAFNGTGQALGQNPESGGLYAVRVDLNPMGGFDRSETGDARGPFRIGIGAGLIVHPFTKYDSAGYPSTGVVDFRGTASVRMTGGGFHILAEGLGRYESDTITHRPTAALGAFGQAGWRSLGGVEPVFRLGWVVEDLSFSPRHAYWGEGGINYYLKNTRQTANPVRLGIHYVGELRYTEREMAHATSAQALVRF
jgi:hypothetical protein